MRGIADAFDLDIRRTEGTQVRIRNLILFALNLENDGHFILRNPFCTVVRQGDRLGWRVGEGVCSMFVAVRGYIRRCRDSDGTGVFPRLKLGVSDGTRIRNRDTSTILMIIIANAVNQHERIEQVAQIRTGRLFGCGGNCFPDGVQSRRYSTVLGAGQRTCLPRLIRSGAVLFKAPPLEGVALAGGNGLRNRECVACFACRVCSMGLRGGRTGAAIGVVVQGKVPFCTHAVITHLIAAAVEFHGIPRLPVVYTENPCAVGCLNACPDLLREGNAELGKCGFGL